MSYLMSNYSPLAVSFVKGNGCYLTDDKGDIYLDALSGVGVMSLGHSHATLIKSMCSQVGKLIHTSNWYTIEPQQHLAKKLCSITKMDKVFFANSGAEANEAAIKITRLFANKHNIQTPIIISANNSFHGRTMATLSATGNTKIQNNLSPLLDGFIFVDFNDAVAIKNLSNNNNIVAVMLEPIQGEHGIIIPDANYLNKVRKICDDNNWLLIVDEIQTGIGRTGKMFACEYNNIIPDILTTAKGLGSGMPIGACIAKGVAAELFIAGSHGSTFGGNHLSCNTAITVLDIIIKENILNNVNNMSAYFKRGLSLIDDKKIIDIRIKGLMIGIELNKNPAPLLKLALKEKLLINITGNTIRMLPPLIISTTEADIIINKITKLIKLL